MKPSQLFANINFRHNSWQIHDSIKYYMVRLRVIKTLKNKAFKCRSMQLEIEKNSCMKAPRINFSR